MLFYCRSASLPQRAKTARAGDPGPAPFRPPAGRNWGRSQAYPVLIPHPAAQDSGTGWARLCRASTPASQTQAGRGPRPDGAGFPRLRPHRAFRSHFRERARSLKKEKKLGESRVIAVIARAQEGKPTLMRMIGQLAIHHSPVNFQSLAMLAIPAISSALLTAGVRVRICVVPCAGAGARIRKGEVLWSCGARKKD